MQLNANYERCHDTFDLLIQYISIKLFRATTKPFNDHFQELISRPSLSYGICMMKVNVQVQVGQNLNHS